MAGNVDMVLFTIDTILKGPEEDILTQVRKYEVREDTWFCCCLCTSSEGNRKVCIPPKIGWMCERPALLARMSITLEQDITKRCRRQHNEKIIQEVQDAAEQLAMHYLSSNKGKMMIQDTFHKMGDSQDDHVLDMNLGSVATLAMRAHEM
eukprot:15364582-Ditylum_brightwellii.AAC.1